MVLRYFQRGSNYSQDGPGNRLVYHLQGCNMRCPWCSNPEGLDSSALAKEMAVDDVVQEIVSACPMFFEGGGVTSTGGEATLQLDAVYDDIVPNEEIPAARINKMREHDKRSAYVSALTAVYDKAGRYTEEATYFIEQVTGHVIPDFRPVLKDGVAALMKDADTRIAAAVLS